MSAPGRWRLRAACRGESPAVWFPPEGNDPAQASTEIPAAAEAACSACEVRSECLLYALENRVLGVWGGTSTHERDAIRRELGIIPAPVVLNRRGARGVLDPVDEPAQIVQDAPEEPGALVLAAGL